MTDSFTDPNTGENVVIRQSNGGRARWIIGIVVGVALTAGAVIVGYGKMQSDVEHVEAAVKEKVGQDVYDRQMLNVQKEISETKKDIKEIKKDAYKTQLETVKQLTTISGEVKSLNKTMKQFMKANSP